MLPDRGVIGFRRAIIGDRRIAMIVVVARPTDMFGLRRIAVVLRLIRIVGHPGIHVATAAVLVRIVGFLLPGGPVKCLVLGDAVATKPPSGRPTRGLRRLPIFPGWRMIAGRPWRGIAFCFREYVILS